MKKWLALLLAAALVLMSTAAVAEIGTADAPVPVSILIKDVSPDDADTIAVVMAIPADGPSLGTAPSGKWT